MMCFNYYFKILSIVGIIASAIACNRNSDSQSAPAKTSPPVTAFMGGSDRGGGNGIGSTNQDVQKGLINAKLQLGVLVHLGAIDQTNILSPTVVKNSRVQKVLQTWFEIDGANERIVLDIISTEYKAQEGDCPSQMDDEHDASTVYQKGATICFSTTRLARFPRWILDAELLALAAHEHAHHFGFAEEDARAVQNYVFDVYGLLQTQLKLSTFYRADLDNYRERVRSGYSPRGSLTARAFAKSICRNLASIEGFASAFNLKWFEMDMKIKNSCDPDQFDPDVVEQRLRTLESKSVQEFNN